MTIETKYNIGDEVYCTIDSEIYELKVIGIKVMIFPIFRCIEYEVVEGDNEPPFYIKEEELLKSL